MGRDAGANDPATAGAHAAADRLLPGHSNAAGSGPNNYAFRTEILELVQDYAVIPPVLRLALRLQLFGASGQTVASRDLVVQETMREATPYAGVVAANDALARALRQAAQFVLELLGALIGGSGIRRPQHLPQGFVPKQKMVPQRGDGMNADARRHEVAKPVVDLPQLLE